MVPLDDDNLRFVRKFIDNASIIQGSGVGPVTYLFNASDLSLYPSSSEQHDIQIC